jgi:tetratricopeptide (TPR) repeat protein
VLDALVSLGLRDRTVVVLTADHGEARGEHGERTHSFFVYDSTIRVPLVFWGAGVPSGVRVPALVRLVDVMPTLLDLLGFPALEGVQGVSLRPLFARPESDLGLTAYGESIEFALAFGLAPLRFVREGRWKYVHKPEPELFDLEADPGELRNVAAKHPKQVAHLRDRLHTLLVAAPPAPDDVTLEMDAEELKQLQALGYVGGAVTEDLAAALESLELSGPDPATRIGDVDEFARAWGLLKESQGEEAAQKFEALFSRNPRSLGVLQGLLEALGQLGREDEMLPLLRRALELDPKEVGARTTLARLLAARGEAAEAERLLREALALDPCAVLSRVELAELLRAGGRERERIALLAEGDDACRDSVVVRNALAFALATSPEAELRDGERALRLAQEAVRETDATHPDYLDTLAAAWAEQGDFERAVTEQERALALLAGHTLPADVVAAFERHLELYRAGKPLRGP